MDRRCYKCFFVFLLYTVGTLNTLSTENSTFDQILRISSWTSPINEHDVIERSASEGTNYGPELLKRQVDPLHSCIEAKCSSWNSGNYLDCIYRHCISSFQMHGRRRNLENNNHANMSEAEGRFLLLPVPLQTHGESQVSLPILTTLRTKRDHKESISARESIDVKIGSKYNKLVKRHASIKKLGGFVQRIPSKIRRNKETKSRRYYDIEGDCVKKMCGDYKPHTIFHLQCKEQCTGSG